MSTVELLIVENSFTIPGRGTVLIPDFSVPDGWRDRIETVTVVKPDGERDDASARFVLTHINFGDPKPPVDRRWRVVVIVSGRSAPDIPAGSAVLVSPELRDSLLRGEAT